MRLITRTFLQAGRLASGASNLLHYAAASTLTLAELREGVRAAWQDFNPRIEDIEEGLRPWEAGFVERFISPGPPGAAVLVAGCGSGRDILPLIARGCRVTGIDPAGTALAAARAYLERRGLAATLVEGFIEDAPINGTFDVVIFSWFSYGLIPESSRRVNTLRRIAGHLNPGGRVILTYESMPRPHAFMITIARGIGWLVRSDWRIEQGNYIARKRFGNREYYSFVHAFLPSEIERESAAAGFRIIDRRDPPGEAVFVLEAV